MKPTNKKLRTSNGYIVAPSTKSSLPPKFSEAYRGRVYDATEFERATSLANKLNSYRPKPKYKVYPCQVVVRVVEGLRTGVDDE